MAWNLDADKPIYAQLMEIIQMQIISGKYQAGGRLPSVRELAAEASVNPNTMQKALSELERGGLVYSQRTSGRFITEDEELLKELKNKKYFLIYGSLQNRKGTRVIAESLYMLLDKYRDIYFVFCGIDYGINKNGAMISAVSYLQRSAKEYDGRVIYLGVLPKNQLIPVIKGAMACILPSRIENLSNACIEAMGLGKIVIATANAGYGQLIAHNENGILFQRDSTVAVKKAVDYFLHMNDAQKEKMGQMAQKVIGHLDAEHCYQKIIELYETVVRNRESGI